MTHLRRLQRDSEFVIVSCKGWAETIVLAVKLGWNPGDTTIEYLAPKLVVNQEKADTLAIIINQVLTLAIENPIEVFPIDVDMGELYLIGDFADRGAFEVHDEPFALQ